MFYDCCLNSFYFDFVPLPLNKKAYTKECNHAIACVVEQGLRLFLDFKLNSSTSFFCIGLASHFKRALSKAAISVCYNGGLMNWIIVVEHIFLCCGNHLTSMLIRVPPLI